MKDTKPDTRSNEELFLAALQGEYDDDLPWAAVAELQLRNTEAVFRFAAAYCESTDPLQRARGLDVLSQLGADSPMSDRPYFDDCVAISIANLSDSDASFVKSAAWALSHLASPLAVSALLTMRDNPDPDVRWSVAFGVAGSEHPAALETLQHLMQDPNNNVRDWATFGLGTLRKENSHAIRLALRQRLADTSEDVRNEALWGLSHRQDREALTTLLARLLSEEWLSGDEMAAAQALGIAFDTPIDELCLRIQELLATPLP